MGIENFVGGGERVAVDGSSNPHSIAVHGRLLGEYETMARVVVEHDVHPTFSLRGELIEERWDFADMILSRVWDQGKVIAKRRFTRAEARSFLVALSPVLDKGERAHLGIEGFDVDVGPFALRALWSSFNQWV